ncbi:MAG: VirK/YbjX family protein [Halothiobacillus sp.]
MTPTLPTAAELYPTDRIKRLLYRLRCLWFAACTRQWHGFLTSQDWLLELTHLKPMLLERIHRPYQQAHLGCPARLARVIEHYAACQAANWQAICLHLARQPWTLCTLRVKDGTAYRIVLWMRESAHKEGEWLLCLHPIDNETPLYSLSLSLRLTRSSKDRVLFIGGLQGPAGGEARETVRQLTRQCYGERPRSLLLDVTRALAAASGCVQLDLVSSHSHIYNHRRKRKKLFFDYDQFALEEGGTRTDEATWALPLKHAARNLTEIPSKKRAEYSRKQALLERITLDVGSEIERLIATHAINPNA